VDIIQDPLKDLWLTTTSFDLDLKRDLAIYRGYCVMVHLYASRVHILLRILTCIGVQSVDDRSKPHGSHVAKFSGPGTFTISLVSRTGDCLFEEFLIIPFEIEIQQLERLESSFSSEAENKKPLRTFQPETQDILLYLRTDGACLHQI
jgi:hypothetical protein